MEDVYRQIAGFAGKKRLHAYPNEKEETPSDKIFSDVARSITLSLEPDINDILKGVGSGLRLSGLYVILFDLNDNKMACRYEWCSAKGHSANGRSVPMPDGSFLFKILGKGEDILIPNVGSIPQDLATEVDLFKKGKISAMAMVPISFSDGKVRGFLEIDNNDAVREWRITDVADFHTVAKMIAVVMERAEKLNAAKEEDEKYRSFVEGTDQVIAVVDIHGKFRFMNNAARKLLGDVSADYFGRTMRDFFPKEIADRQSGSVRAAVESGEKKVIQSKSMVRGNEIWYETSIYPIKYKDKCDSALIVAGDITSRMVEQHDIAVKSIMLDRAKDTMVLVGLDGKIILANDNAYRSRGYTKEEFCQLSIDDVDIDGVGNQFVNRIAEVIEKGEMTFESEHRCKDGKIINVEVHASTIQCDGKNMVLGIARDITMRKKAEDAIREARKSQETLLNSIPDNAWLKDRDCKFTAVNEVLAKTFGFTPQEMVGKTDFDIAPRELAERYIADDREVMRSGKQKRVEEPFPKPDSSIQWIETIKTPIRNDKGDIIGTVGISRDISARLRMEEELASQYHLLRQIMDSIPSPVFMKNLNGEYTDCNKAFETFFCISKEKIVGHTAYTLVPKELADTFKQKDEELLNSSGIQIYETVIPTGSGEKKNVIFCKTKVSKPDGTVNGIIGVGLDITDRIKAETALQREKATLDLLNAELQAKVKELESAVGHIKKIEGLIPICMDCKKMKLEGEDPDDPKNWVPIEKYISTKTDANLTHGLCPDCVKKMYGKQLKRGT